MNPALLFLVRRSLVNSVIARVRRLRNPRYLLLFLVGAAYFALVFGPWRDGAGTTPLPPGVRPIPVERPPDRSPVFYEWIAAALALAFAAGAWILPARRSPLAFLEPEVALLFPAPLTRKELVSYKLLDTQKYLVFTGLFFALMALFRSGPFRAATTLVGWWLAFAVLSFHQVGAHLARKSLLDHGVSGWKRMGVPLLAVAGLAAAVILGAPPLPALGGPGALDRAADWLEDLGKSPAGWALLPFRLLGRPMFAADLPSFLVHSVCLAGLGVLLYLWVIRTDAAFEEAAAEQATDLARRIDAARRGKAWTGDEARRKVRRNPWRLGAAGPPETAFLWKSVSESLRSFSPRLVGILVAALVVGIVLGTRTAPGGSAGWIRGAAGAVMLAGAGILVLGGPSFLGSNLRQDMEQVEVLKTLPVSPGRLVRCSLAGAVLPTALLQAALVLGAAFVLPDPPGREITVAWRVAGAAGLSLVLPSLCALSAAADAAGVLFFPAWVRPGQPPAQGVEAMGYGIVLMFGKFALLGLGLLAPSLLAGLVILAARFAGPAALPAGAFLASGALALGVLGELLPVTELLGRRFARLDPAEEGILS